MDPKITPPTPGTVSRRIYPVITIARIQNPIRFFAVPLLGGIVKWFMLIPQAFMLLWAYLVVGVGLWINVFTVLFKGRYYRHLYNWNVNLTNMTIKSRFFMLGLTNKYPGFTYAIEDNYTVAVPFPLQPNRLYAIPLLGFALRFIILLPYFFYISIIGNAVEIMTVFSSFAVLFKGYYPESTYELVLDEIRLSTSLPLYVSGISDTIPTYKISMHHNVIKIIFLIMGILLLGWQIYSNVSDQKNPKTNSYSTTSPVSAIGVEPEDKSIKCKDDMNCFVNAMEQNKVASFKTYNDFTIEGIAFQQLIYIRFDGYKDNHWKLYGKTLSIDVADSNSGNLEITKTINNVKDIALHKEVTIPIYSSMEFTKEDMKKNATSIVKEFAKLLIPTGGIYVDKEATPTPQPTVVLTATPTSVYIPTPAASISH